MQRESCEVADVEGEDQRHRAEASAVRAIAGEAPITGKLPIALPKLAAWVRGLDVLHCRVPTPAAVFAFADDPGDVPGAVPFDMYGTREAGFGHDGDRCTFETMASAFGIECKPGRCCYR